jgi:hypothetical protein
VRAKPLAVLATLLIGSGLVVIATGTRVGGLRIGVMPLLVIGLVCAAAFLMSHLPEPE